jgi:cell division protease FtsH
VLSDTSTGAENDLKEATDLATKMVANFGMSKALGPVYYDHRDAHPFLGQRIATDSGTSDATVSVIETEARAELATALECATEVIASNRAALDRLVSVLLEKETVEKKELTEILGTGQGSLALVANVGSDARH